MTESFSDHLRRLADPIWAAQHAHPFVRGIGDGTLPLDKFRFWVRQDYLYLIDYARVFSAGAVRAPDLDTMTAFAEFAAALLPCMWGYCEVGERLAARGMPAEPRHAKWIAMYSAPEFAELARWCRKLVDTLGADAPAPVRRRMEEAFLTSSRYELAFWEMAWTLEKWPDG